MLPWQHLRRHSVPFVMYISGAKFEERRCNISADILDSVINLLLSGTINDIITFSICISKKKEMGAIKNILKY